MGTSRETVVEVTLGAAGSPTDTLRVWDAPSGEPFKDISICLSSAGEITAAGNLSWRVYYGGSWDGKPFDRASKHLGGISQGNGVLAGGTEIASVVYSDVKGLPSNRRDTNRNMLGIGGFPVVVELINAKAVPVKVFVTFVSTTVTTKS